MAEPNHPKFRMLTEAVARAEQLPDLPENPRLACRAFLASADAGAAWCDRHTALMLGRVLFGLLDYVDLKRHPE
jgi:hypothetical protein